MDTGLIRDNFLDNYDWFRGYCDGLTYGKVTSENDGVEYEGICTDIPTFMGIDVLYKLQQLIGPISDYKLFLRLSLEGVKAPHEAHNDLVMGQYTMVLYLNREEHCQGGTSLVSHKELGMAEGVQEGEELETWQRDVNNYDAWEIDEMFHMKPNRAIILPSNRMHRAEGNNYGTDTTNGRLVMICFFNVS